MLGHLDRVLLHFRALREVDHAFLELELRQVEERPRTWTAFVVLAGVDELRMEEVLYLLALLLAQEDEASAPDFFF